MQVDDKPIGKECVGDSADIEMQAVGGLLDAHRDLHRHLYANLQEHHGLLPTEYDMLFAINQSSSACGRMSDLANSARLSVSGMSRLADRLEKRGIVQRQSSPEDGRGLNLVLTDAGRELMAQARGTHLAVVRQHFLRYFTDAELEQMVALWQKLPLDGSPCPE